MPKGMTVKTDGRMILVWRKSKEGHPHDELAAKYKVSVSTIGKWIREVNDDPDLRLAANSERKIVVSTNNISSQNKPKTNGVKSKSPKKDLEIIARLQDELAFMKWWNKGERSGYVERLLKLLQQG